MPRLIRVEKLDNEKALAYKNEFMSNNEVIHGGARLDSMDNISDWKQYSIDSYHVAAPGFVTQTSFFLIDDHDYPLGIINIRHELNDMLLKSGGHIGYSVRKSQRQKGYAKEMLGLALDYCWSRGMDKVLITASDDNPASYKTIEACGGVLENTITDSGDLVRRYWITHDNDK